VVCMIEVPDSSSDVDYVRRTLRIPFSPMCNLKATRGDFVPRLIQCYMTSNVGMPIVCPL
jgi:hypothetical protein